MGQSKLKWGGGVGSRAEGFRVAGSWSGPRLPEFWASGVAVLVVISGLGLTTAFAPLVPRSLSAIPSAVGTGTRSTVSLLQEAEESLAAGGGPSDGTPMVCSPTGGGATCSTTSGGVSASSSPPAPSFPHRVTPSARYGASFALFLNGTSEWDVLLFGGANSSGEVFNDTWEFNTVNLTWWNVTPYLHCTLTSCPGARHDATATWDSADSYVVLFGGCAVASPGWTQSTPGCDTSSGSIRSGTWSFSDPSGGVGSWTKLSPKVSPPARFAEGLASNCSNPIGTGGGCAGSGVILFGGYGTTGPLGDTWEFSGGQWTNLNLATHPSARYGMAMAFAEGNSSTASQVVTLFGGCTSSVSGCADGTGSVNDTWLFYGGGWHQAIAASSCSATRICPAARYYMGGTSYQGPGLPRWLLIYGGVGRNGLVFGNATEKGGGWWTFDSMASPATWRQWPSVPGYLSGKPANGSLPGWFGPYPLGPPAPRYDPMLLGNWNDGGILFGGSSASGSSLGDTWWAGNSPSPHSGLLWPPPTPAAEYGGSMVYDRADRYDVLFGGCGPHCGNVTTWNYTANLWMPWGSFGPKVNPSNSPPGRMNASMIFFNSTTTGTTTATSSQVVLLFGGLATNGTLLNDLWTFSGGVWTKANETGAIPSPRQSAAFAYNSSANVAVLFGGCGSTCPLSDTYLLNYSSYSSSWKWTAITPATSPPARYAASMTYDARDSEILLFGGRGATGPLADTWTYDNNSSTWNQCTATACTGSNAPSARWGAAMTYDSADRFVVLFGGCGATCPLDDTWTYVGGSWARLLTANSPPGSYDSAVANDTRGGYVLLVGGIGASGEPLGGLGWVFQGNNWRSATVSNAIPRPTIPLPRYGMSLAYSPTGNYVLVVGGCQDTGIGACGPLMSHSDTWEYVNGGWKVVCSNCGPSARWDASLTFDEADNYFLLVGGCRATSLVCSTASVLGDAWKFGNGNWTLLPTPPFAARGDAAMTWDGADNIVVLFGGIGCSGVCGDSWEYVGGKWTAIQGTLPPPRWGAAIGYDALPTDRYVVMEGGVTTGGAILSDTWTFTLSAGWRQLAITPPGAPRYDGAMAYDPIEGYLLLVGGLTTGGKPVSGDGWTYASGRWTQLSGPWPIGPRWGMGLVFDQSAGPMGMMMLIGGSAGPGGLVQNVTTESGTSPGQGDTWEFLGAPTSAGAPVWFEVTLYG